MKYIEFLEKYSAVNSRFINDFFSQYDDKTKPGDFVIDLDMVAKYLQALKKTLMETLRESYVENVDYKIVGKVESEKTRRGPKSIKILLTSDAFKLLCMQSRSKKAKEVRLYFLQVEKTLMSFKDTINESLMQRVQALESNQKPIATETQKRGIVYIILVSQAMSLYKIGQTMNMRHRASTYMADKADNADLKIVHMYETENAVAVEGCLKSLLKEKQYRKRKEVYQIDIDILKKLIHEHCGPGADMARPNMNLIRSNNETMSAKKGGGGDLYAVIL